MSPVKLHERVQTNERFSMVSLHSVLFKIDSLRHTFYRQFHTNTINTLLKKWWCRAPELIRFQRNDPIIKLLLNWISKLKWHSSWGREQLARNFLWVWYYAPGNLLIPVNIFLYNLNSLGKVDSTPTPSQIASPLWRAGICKRHSSRQKFFINYYDPKSISLFLNRRWSCVCQGRLMVDHYTYVLAGLASAETLSYSFFQTNDERTHYTKHLCPLWKWMDCHYPQFQHSTASLVDHSTSELRTCTN
jgi:hypothetical protein